MTTPTFVQNTRFFLCAIIGVSAFTGSFGTECIAAEGSPLTVAIHVDSHGLNLRDDADARKFYRRIKNAAWVACTSADRVGLTPVDDPQECMDHSLAAAIRSAALPALARIFLESHTLKQAAAMGIDVQMVAVAK